MNNQLSNHPNDTTTQSLIKNLLDGNGNTIIKINPETNLVHLTYLCQKVGKRAENYTRSDRFKNLKAALEEENSSTLYYVVENGGSNPGTWVHPDIAVDAAMWCSPKFGIAVSRLVRSYLTGHVTTEQSQAAARQLMPLISQEDQLYRMRLLDIEEGKLNLEKGKLTIEEAKLNIEKGELNIRNVELGERLMTNADLQQGIITKQTLRDAGLSLISSTSSSNIQSEKWFDVPRILTEIGRPQRDGKKIGRSLAKRWRNNFSEEPKKEEKLVNGSMRKCCVYPESKLSVIRTWIDEM